MKIEHIAIYVKNLEQEKEFFEKYFNARSGAIYENKTKGFSSYLSHIQEPALSIWQYLLVRQKRWTKLLKH